MLQDHLPWAQHLGESIPRNTQRDNVIDRIGQLAETGRDTSVAAAEAADLVARRAHLSRRYRDEATAHDRFITTMVTRHRERARSRSHDDGLEL